MRSAGHTARYDGYLADEGLMARLRAMVPRSAELYRAAQAGYLAQWGQPMGTC